MEEKKEFESNQNPEQRVGSILYTLRTEQGIGQEELCRGLCSKAALSRYELGERMPDRLLLNRLLQRLGKDADKMITVLSAEEYEYLMWRKAVLTALGQENMDMVSALLEEPEAVRISFNEVLQKQFLYRMQAILADRVEQDTEKSIVLYRRAAELTMPELENMKWDRCLLSVEEVQLLLDLAEALMKGNRREDAERLLTKLVKYADEHFSDYEAKVKIYPNAVRLLYPVLIEKKEYLKCMLLCQKAIELLCWNGVLYGLAELMEGYLRCSNIVGETEQAARYKKQLWALKGVYEEYGQDAYQKENSFLAYSNREVYLINEVVRTCRLDKKMSQEDLSEEICSPETLSRIESGKRAPNVKNFRALMKKLDEEIDYYNGKLDTTDFLLLEKYKKLEREMAIGEWEKAEKLINELETSLDLSNPLNKWTIDVTKSCILFNQGKMEAKEFRKICEQALGCEQEEWRKEDFWSQFFSDYRIQILNYIGGIYFMEQEEEKALYIMRKLFQQLTESKVELSDRYSTSLTVIRNLSTSLGELGKVEECLKMCDIGIRFSLMNGRGNRLPYFLSDIVEVEGMFGKPNEKNVVYLKWAYYLSDLLEMDKKAKWIDQYFKENYEEIISWY